MPSYPTCRVTNTNTCWIFLSGSAESRHLSDIIFGVEVLRKRGVSDSNILVFTDHPAYQTHFAPYAIQSVHPARAITTQLAQCTQFELAFVIVTGDGDRDGIAVTIGSSINPTELLNATRACPGLKGGALILGQCYAGLWAERGCSMLIG